MIPCSTSIGAYRLAVIFNNEVNGQFMIPGIFDALVSHAGFRSHLAHKAVDFIGAAFAFDIQRSAGRNREHSGHNAGGKNALFLKTEGN